MPGYAWGIPAKFCITGSQLAKVPGTPCHTCYALKGRFLWPNVKKAYMKRFDTWLNSNNNAWVKAMVEIINSLNQREFRWFDSGDIQSEDMLDDIIKVVKQTSSVTHWLPTQERNMVKGKTLPKNLVVRVSATMIGGPTPKGFRNTSRVVPRALKHKWAKLVARNTKYWYYCPSPLQKNECGDCRACWDPEVKVINYLEH